VRNGAKRRFWSEAEKPSFCGVSLLRFGCFVVRVGSAERSEKRFSERSVENLFSRRDALPKRVFFGVVAVGCWLLAVSPRGYAKRAKRARTLQNWVLSVNWL
jgi:hypothetical protein